MSGWCHRIISDYPHSNHNSYKTTYAMALGYPKLNTCQDRQNGGCRSGSRPWAVKIPTRTRLLQIARQLVIRGDGEVIQRQDTLGSLELHHRAAFAGLHFNALHAVDLQLHKVIALLQAHLKVPQGPEHREKLRVLFLLSLRFPPWRSFASTGISK